MVQMQPQFFREDSDEIPWTASRFATGVEIKNLGKANGRAIQLVRFQPGVAFPDHLHTGPEFIYVLDGEVIQNGQRLGKGWVGAAERGTLDHAFRSDTGCVFLLVYDVDQVFDSVAEPD